MAYDPFYGRCGDEGWVCETAKRLGLESSLRPVGRPKAVMETGDTR